MRITRLQHRALVRANIWRKIDYVPHDGQRRIHRAVDNGAKRIISLAGRRGGKSEGWGTEAVTELAFTPDGHLPLRITNIAGPESDITDNIFGLVWKWVVDEKVLGSAPLHKSTRSRYIEMPWRSRIEGKTTKDPTSLRGQGVVLTIADEYAFGKDVLNEYLLPPLLDCDGILGIPTTPNGYNHLRDLYVDWSGEMEKGDPFYYTTKWTSYDNPYLNGDEIKRTEAAYYRTGNELTFRQEYLAEFESPAGAVYPQFNRDRHVTSVEYISELPVFIGVDWGFNNPASIIFGQFASEQVRLFDEIYVRGRTAQQLAQLTIEKLASYGIDHRNEDQLEAVYADPSGAEEKQVWRGEDFTIRDYTVNGSKLNDVDAGIVVVRAQLAREDVPGVLIDKDRCPMVIKYLPAYHYSEKALDDKPVKEDDHMPDAIRYLIYGKLGSTGALDWLRELAGEAA